MLHYKQVYLGATAMPKFHSGNGTSLYIFSRFVKLMVEVYSLLSPGYYYDMLRHKTERTVNLAHSLSFTKWYYIILH